MDTPTTARATGHLRAPRIGLMALIVSTVVLLDQVTKWQVTKTMLLHESIPIIPGFFSLTYIRNAGAAFGILSGSHAGFRMVFFGLTSVVALALLGTIYVRLAPGDWIGQASVAAIFGGAVGNLIDRIRYGEVIDFLDFSLRGYHWPAFNVADAAITVGVCLLILHFFQHKNPHPTSLPRQESEG